MRQAPASAPRTPILSGLSSYLSSHSSLTHLREHTLLCLLLKRWYSPCFWLKTSWLHQIPKLCLQSMSTFSIFRMTNPVNVDTPQTSQNTHSQIHSSHIYRLHGVNTLSELTLPLKSGLSSIFPFLVSDGIIFPVTQARNPQFIPGVPSLPQHIQCYQILPSQQYLQPGPASTLSPLSLSLFLLNH